MLWCSFRAEGPSGPAHLRRWGGFPAAGSPPSPLDPADPEPETPRLHSEKFKHRSSSAPLIKHPTKRLWNVGGGELLTRARFIGHCLTFLPGNKPVHFIEHSVNLRQDQQLGEDVKVRTRLLRSLTMNPKLHSQTTDTYCCCCCRFHVNYGKMRLFLHLHILIVEEKRAANAGGWLKKTTQMYEDNCGLFCLICAAFIYCHPSSGKYLA